MCLRLTHLKIYEKQMEVNTISIKQCIWIMFEFTCISFYIRKLSIIIICKPTIWLRQRTINPAMQTCFPCSCFLWEFIFDSKCTQSSCMVKLSNVGGEAPVFLIFGAKGLSDSIYCRCVIVALLRVSWI